MTRSGQQPIKDETMPNFGMEIGVRGSTKCLS